MSDANRLADNIASDLRLIRTAWPDMLEPTSSGPSQRVTSSRDAPTPVPINVLSVRRETDATLTSWALLVAEERDLRTNLQAGDVPNVAGWLMVHADWLAHHEAGQAAAGEIAKVATDCDTIAHPPRPEGQSIGRCPVMIGTEACGAQVRAYPEISNLITCKRCGTEDTLGWWQSQIIGNPDASPLVTATELISIVAFEAKVILTHDVIRQWASRQPVHIQRHGKDTKGRTLYRHAEVVEYVRGLRVEGLA